MCRSYRACAHRQRFNFKRRAPRGMQVSHAAVLHQELKVAFGCEGRDLLVNEETLGRRKHCRNKKSAKHCNSQTCLNRKTTGAKKGTLPKFVSIASTTLSLLSNWFLVPRLGSFVRLAGNRFEPGLTQCCSQGAVDGCCCHCCYY